MIKVKIIRVFIIVFSLFVLWLTVSVFINSKVCLTYEAASEEDITNVIFYSKVIFIYALSIVIFLVTTFFNNK